MPNKRIQRSESSSLYQGGHRSDFVDNASPILTK